MTTDRRIGRTLAVFISLLLFLSTGGLLGQPKIVSLSPTPTEIVYALGARDQLLGVTTFCVFPDQVIEDKRSGKMRVVSDFNTTDVALVDSLAPDVILTDTFFQRDIAEEFRKKGYTVLHFEPRSLEEVFESIEQIGEAIGRGDVAKTLTQGYRKQVNDIYAVASQLPKVKVYMEINHEGPWVVGSQSPLEDIIRYAGGENIFGDIDDGVFVADNEEIVRRNPDVILSPIWIDAKLDGYDGITTILEISSRQGYDSTNAVKYGRVLYYDSALLKHEGPRQVLAIRKLAYLLHPEAFDSPVGTIPWELGNINGALKSKRDEARVQHQ